MPFRVELVYVIVEAKSQKPIFFWMRLVDLLNILGIRGLFLVGAMEPALKKRRPILSTHGGRMGWLCFIK